MDKTVPIPEQSYPSSQTMNIGSDEQLDTDLRRFTEDDLRRSIPSKRRTLRIYMPQEVEPMVLMDVEHLVIGRESGDNRLDLSLQFAKMLGVSRDHAEITYREGQYSITDLGSTNGTYLNNRKLEAQVPHHLEHSDQLRFGHFVMIIGFS